MSDVSKTNEDLRKALNVAREHFTAIAGSGEIKVWEDTGEKRGIDYQAKVWAERGARLASEALAATRVPVQGEPKRKVPHTGPGHPHGDAHYCEGCLAEQEARQGEPNDDRTPEFEAIEQELFKHQPVLSMQDGSIRGCKCMDRVFLTKTEDWGTHLAEVFEQLSRATVPDAATAETFAEKMERKHGALAHLQGLLGEVRAERDAATAAIDAIRAIHTKGSSEVVESTPDGPRVSHFTFHCDVCVDVRGEHEEYPCATRAALDGAPEPETAPENYEPKCNGACVVHGSPVTNWPVQYGRRHRETGALHWLKGDPFDSWWHENQDSYEHVKRYTSPPLPVEGESKP